MSRIINAARNKSKEAKVYSKAYDQASALSDKADAAWNEANQAYKRTGKTYITRVYNNMKYDLKKN